MRLKSKMLWLVAVFALSLFAMGAISVFGVQHLGTLQHEGNVRAEDHAAAREIGAVGARLYLVIANTIIDRDLAASAKEWAKEKAVAHDKLKRLGEMADTPEEHEAAAAAKKGLDALEAIYEQELLPLLAQTMPDWEAIRALDERMDVQIDAIHDNSWKVAESMAVDAREADKQFKATELGIFSSNLVVASVLLLVAGGMAWSIMRNILRQLGGEPAYAVKVANAIAAGDLTVEVETDPQYGDSLLASMRSMSKSLNRMVGQITAMSRDLVSASERVASAARQVSGASASQSDAAASMSAAVEEMSASVALVADSSESGERLAREAGDLAQTSNANINQVVSEIQQIANDVERSSGSIGNLREQSNQIHAVINVIKEVADQTNLLALNAAIEAARAGEQGRGFAVVADEVRKLAERTAQSTEEIARIIESIRDGVGDATDSIAHSNRSMSEGVRLATSTRDSIGTISRYTGDVLSSARDISNALREQRSASGGIAEAVEQIAQMAEENSAATQDIAQSAERLDKMANQLNTLVGKFRI